MRFLEPFLKLPISFSADALRVELRALPDAAWIPHATGFAGNVAVRLVTVGGAASDSFEGPMRPTEYLERSTYIREIMAELGGVWGRSRLMGLDPAAEVPAHVDVHYYWRTHLRIHIPIVTNPGVTFTCGAESVHMAPGECWVFDSFRWHDVQNTGSERRVHLVLDTVPTARLWDLVDSARSETSAPVRLDPGMREAGPLMFENFNASKVMSPWEMRCHIAYLTDHSEKGPALDRLSKSLDRFVDGWASLWSRFGATDQGLQAYSDYLSAVNADLKRDASAVMLDNDLPFYTAFEQSVLIMAIHPAVQMQLRGTAPEQRVAS